MHSVYFVYEKPCSYVHVLPANAKRILKSQAVFMFCKSLVVNLWRQQFYCICIRRKYESGFIPQSTVKWFGIVQSAYRCRKLCRWKCHASRWCVMSVSIRTPINTPEGGQGGVHFEAIWHVLRPCRTRQLLQASIDGDQGKNRHGKVKGLHRGILKTGPVLYTRKFLCKMYGKLVQRKEQKHAPQGCVLRLRGPVFSMHLL